jgi:uncharacterized protein (TIGR02145 family)
VLKTDVSRIIFANGTEEGFNNKSNEEGDALKGTSKYGVFTDKRDLVTYQTIVIGFQVWFRENLRYHEPGIGFELLPGDSCTSCCVYYNYNDALKACPAGWHLPSDEEWMEIEMYYGMLENEADGLFWRGTGSGQAPALLENGKSSLDLIMCGHNPNYSGTYDRTFSTEAYYWTSTDKNEKKAMVRRFAKRASIFRGFYSKDNLMSVRCVKN